MPELPEVETIKRELEKTVLGKRITEVCVHNPKVIREPGVEEFKKGLAGATIKNILRRAKVLILELSNGKSLVIHLKMTGQLVYPGKGGSARVVFRLSGAKALDFNDQRLFAELRLLDDWSSLKFIRGLGPEPFDITLGKFKEMLDAKKTKIKPLLMDQKFIAGVGNIYAQEACFCARISPKRIVGTLAAEEIKNLYQCLQKILAAALARGGSSVDSYVNALGEKGGYVPFLKVYRREGEPCIGCKGKVKTIKLAGRGTSFCPSCQK